MAAKDGGKTAVSVKRVLVVSTAGNTDQVVDCLRREADELDIVLHFGRRHADFMTASISRMEPMAARKGHLVAQGRYAAAAADLMLAPTYHEDMLLFLDHFLRRDPLFANNPHKLETPHDYMDFFHILIGDHIAQMQRHRVEAVLFFNVPHLSYDTVIYQLARARGLEVLILTQMLLPGKLASMRSIDDLGHAPLDNAAPPLPIEKSEKLDLFYMPEMRQEPGTRRLTARNLANLAVYLAKKEPSALVRPSRLAAIVRRMRAAKERFPKWRDPFARYFHTHQFAYLEHLAEFEGGDVNFDQPFVYFPLQLQPEMTTSALGGRFRDQVFAIEQLSGLLPDGVKIYVKENPKQGAFMRGPLVFHRLSRIPSVEILPSHADTHLLADRAHFVAVITGTAGWEAIRKGKPALVFGNAWYADLPGVTRYREGLTYEEIVGAEIEHADLERKAGALVARFHDGIVERHYAGQVAQYDAKENARRVARLVRDLFSGRLSPSFQRLPDHSERARAASTAK
ncbi:MAG: hypothetical protein AAFY59_06265 [Pseudomonadota bacterium]